MAGCCEHVNELWGSIKGGEFLDWLSDLASQEGLCYVELVSLRAYKEQATLPKLRYGMVFHKTQCIYVSIQTDLPGNKNFFLQ
jgi:hypothetical protein